MMHTGYHIFHCMKRAILSRNDANTEKVELRNEEMKSWWHLNLSDINSTFYTQTFQVIWANNLFFKLVWIVRGLTNTGRYGENSEIELCSEANKIKLNPKSKSNRVKKCLIPAFYNRKVILVLTRTKCLFSSCFCFQPQASKAPVVALNWRSSKFHWLVRSDARIDVPTQLLVSKKGARLLSSRLGLRIHFHTQFLTH